MVEVLAAGLLLAVFYAYVTGMRDSNGLAVMTVTTLAVSGVAMEAAGFHVFGQPFPPAAGILDLPLLRYTAALLLFYLVFTRLPTDRHILFSIAVFDRLLDGVGVRKSYHRHRAGKVMEGILQDREIACYR